MAIPGPDVFSFGTLLKGFRTRRRLTQQQLAQAISVHRSAVNRWEQGSFLPKQKGIVLELARCLKLDEPETRQLLEASLTALAPYWSVPLPRNPYFTGREEILDVVHTHLATNRVVALTQSYALQGLGGIGKTQLALEYTYQYALEYSALFWIEAETEATVISSLLRLADVVQLPERKEADQQRLVAAVQRWLSCHSGWLLIWDNLEDFDLLARFLPSTRPGAILITTRCQALGTLARGIDLEPMGEEEGVLLLLRRAKLVEPQATPDDVRHLAVEKPSLSAAAHQLVTVLGRLPLAVDQAGAYIEETGCRLAEYGQRYSQRRLLLLDRRGLSSHHPLSVVATLRLTCQRVAEEQPAALDLLRCCAFLSPDAIPEELFLAGADYLGPVLGPVVADATQFDLAVATLRRYSLVQRHSDSRTLSLHRLVQVIVQDDLSAHEQDLWRQRLVHLLNVVVPSCWDTTEPAVWEPSGRLLPQVMTCTAAIPEHLQDQDLADLLGKAADYLFMRSQYALAESLYQRALQIQAYVSGPVHPKIAAVLEHLADLQRTLGNYDQAESSLHAAVGMLEQVYGPEHPDVASALDFLATVYRGQGKYELAGPLLHRALSIQEQALGPEHLEVAHSLNRLGILYKDQGKYDLAEAAYQRVLAIHEQVLGSNHPDIAFILNNLGELYTEQGKYELAEPYCQRAVRLIEHALGAEHFNTACMLDTLATVYSAWGRYDRAEPLYQRCLPIFEQVLGPAHRMVAYSLSGLAILSREQGRFEEAEALFYRALRIRKQVLGGEHPETAQTLHDVAILRQKEGKVREACSLAKRALAIRTQSLGETHPKTVAIRSLYSQLVQEQGSSPEEEPACGQPTDPHALDAGQEPFPVQVMQVTVRGATGQVAYTRLVRMRDVTFTCTMCGHMVTQLHHPSGRIKYCSEACRALSAAQRQQVRVAKQREQRRIARGARLQAQQGNGL